MTDPRGPVRQIESVERTPSAVALDFTTHKMAFQYRPHAFRGAWLCWNCVHEVWENGEFHDPVMLTTEHAKSETCLICSNTLMTGRNRPMTHNNPLTIFEQGIIQDYKFHLDYMEKAVASIHGVLTRNDIDRRDSLEHQLVNRNLSRFMSTEALDNYRYHMNVFAGRV